ncbi:MAG: tetratricopeptide repeat protein [Bacillota bacterium]
MKKLKKADILSLSEEVLIKEYVREVFENIRLYKEELDYEIIDILLRTSIENKLSIETIMMYGAKAEYLFGRGDINQAVELFRKAIKLAEKKDNNLVVLFMVELADLYYREGMLPEAEAEYKLAESYANKQDIDVRTIFKYNYWRGIMLNSINKHFEARELFHTAYQYALTIEQKTAAMLNIGLTYKKEQRFEEAMDIYKKLLSLYGEKDLIGRGAVYNNIAVIEMERGCLKEALKNSIKAITLVALTTDINNKVKFYHTYTQVRLMMGGEAVCSEYFEVLLSTIGRQVNKKFIVADIMSIADMIPAHMLERLIVVITEMAQASYNEHYINDLHSCAEYIRKKI